MAEQGKEQLLIEARLQDYVTKEAARISQALKSLDKDVSGIGAAGTQSNFVAKQMGLLRQESTLLAGGLRGLSVEADAAGGGLLALGGASLGIVAGVTTVGGALVKAASDALTFERAMSGVLLRLDQGETTFDEFNQSVLGISLARGVGADMLAGGATEALTRFNQSGKDAIVILDELARTAKLAGQEEARTFQQVIAVLDGYNLAADRAGTTTEELAAAALHGKSTFGEMAQELVQLAPLAKGLGFGFRENLAVLSAMTKEMGNAGLAGNALRTTYSRLLSDNTLNRRLQEVGSSFAVGKQEGNELVGTLKDLQVIAAGNANEMNQLFGGMRGASAVLALTRTGSDALKSSFDSLAVSTDIATQKLRMLEETSSARLDKLGNKIATLWKMFGSQVVSGVGEAIPNALMPELPSPAGFEGTSQPAQEAALKARIALAKGDAAAYTAAVAEYAAALDHMKQVTGSVTAAIGELLSGENLLKTVTTGATGAFLLGVHGANKYDETLKGAWPTVDEFTKRVHEANDAVVELSESSASQAAGPGGGAQAVFAPDSEKVAAAQKLLAQIQQRSATGLEAQRLQQRAILADIEKQIAGYEQQRVDVSEIRAALVELKQADAERLNLAETRQRLSLDQQIATLNMRALEVEQERARAVQDFNRAEDLGERILQERARSSIAASELQIAGLEEQRRAYPEIADELDKVIGKIREQQYVEGQRARAAMGEADLDARAEALKAEAEQMGRVFDAEQQLVELRANGLTGLERELAQIELNRAAAVERAREEALLDGEKAKNLQNIILLLDGEAARQEGLARQNARVDLMRTEADLVASVARSREGQLEALIAIRAIDRERMILTATENKATEEQLDLLKHLFDLQTQQQTAVLAAGFAEGMEQVLQEFADTAGRMAEAGAETMHSFHDEGAGALSDLLKGNLSGGDALKQFGQGFFGNVIDQGSSLIFDQITNSIFGAGDAIEAAGSQAAGGVQGAGGLLTGALQGLAGGLGGFLQGLFGGGGGIGEGLIPQAQGGVWGGTLLPVHAAGGGVYGRRTLLEVAEIAGRQEAVVPMHNGGIMADMTSRGPRVRVAGADIPLGFRGGGRESPTVNVANSVNVSLTVTSLDPRGAADVVLAQMPKIQKAIASALVQGSDRQLRDAVQGAAR